MSRNEKKNLKESTILRNYARIPNTYTNITWKRERWESSYVHSQFITSLLNTDHNDHLYRVILRFFFFQPCSFRYILRIHTSKFFFFNRSTSPRTYLIPLHTRDLAIFYPARRYPFYRSQLFICLGLLYPTYVCAYICFRRFVKLVLIFQLIGSTRMWSWNARASSLYSNLAVKLDRGACTVVLFFHACAILVMVQDPQHPYPAGYTTKCSKFFFFRYFVVDYGPVPEISCEWYS